MGLKIITLQVPEEQLLALDALAAAQHLDRGKVFEEAVDQYLSLHDYHRQLIELGIRADDAGNVIDHASVRTLVGGWVASVK